MSILEVGKLPFLRYLREKSWGEIMKTKTKILLGLGAVSFSVAAIAHVKYYYEYAFTPKHKKFIKQPTNAVEKNDPLYKEKTWFLNEEKQTWRIKSANDKYELVASYIPKAESHKTVILLHGFMSNKYSMGKYAYFFNKKGYNVLLPDAQSHGKSGGKYINYGWREKDDLIKWIDEVIGRTGSDQKIVLLGESMGAATVMMTSGEDLPDQVKAIIEDCGYSNVKDEIIHQASSVNKLPKFVNISSVDLLSAVNRLVNGYFLKNASVLKQLNKNYLPTLFIHGEKDDFVPTKMAYQNYNATRGPKELWIVKDTGHAESLSTDPKGYYKHLNDFLNKYVG